MRNTPTYQINFSYCNMYECKINIVPNINIGPYPRCVRFYEYNIHAKRKYQIVRLVESGGAVVTRIEYKLLKKITRFI